MRYFFTLFFSFPLCLAGQTKYDSLQAVEDSRIYNVYSLTGNPAALWLLPIPDYGQVTLHAKNISGKFKKPLESGSYTTLGAGAEGLKRQKALIYKGSFHYEKRFDQNLNWTNEYDAYNGNPFLWADSSSGSWSKDHIRARVDISASPWKKVLFSGLRLDYHVGTGARTNDPKPFYRFRSISVQPGFLYKVSFNREIGLSGGGTAVLENNELGFYNRGTNNVLLYRLRGYGTFSKVPFVSGERTRKGHVWTAGTHWDERIGLYRLLLYGNMRWRNEVVTEGIAQPDSIGSFREKNLDAGVYLFKGDSDRGNSLKIRGVSVQGKGRDKVFQAENSVFFHNAISGQFNDWRYVNGAKTFVKAAFGLGFDTYSQTDKASGSRFSVNTIETKSEWLIRKYFSKRKQLELYPEFAYVYVVKDAYFVQNDNVLLREIVRKDFEFKSSSYISGNLKLKWSTFTSKKGGHSFFFDVNCLQSLEAAKPRRTVYQIGYALLF